MFFAGQQLPTFGSFGAQQYVCYDVYVRLHIFTISRTVSIIHLELEALEFSSGADLGVSEEPCISWGFRSLTGRGICDF